MHVRDENKIIASAIALRNARKASKGITQISEEFNIKNISEAYAVAEINTLYAESQGKKIVGKKIGLTSRAVQTQLGVNQPDFGILFDDMQYENHAAIQIAQFIQPKIEAEIAFILGEDIPDNINNLSDLLSCISHAVAVLEIVDSAIVDWKITIEDTIADNASSAAFVCSQNYIEIQNLNFTNLDMKLFKNGAKVSQSNMTEIIHPLHAVLWLAKEMNRRKRPLKKGEIILSGALGPMVDVRQGDHIKAEIAGLGQVNCSFQ